MLRSVGQGSSLILYTIPPHFENGENETDRRSIHTKTVHLCRQILKTVDFENGALNGTF